MAETAASIIQNQREQIRQHINGIRGIQSTTLYKLIREQRSTFQTDTDIIFIDDMILNTDEKILNGWNAHFERLSTPDINHHNNNGLCGIRMRTHRTNNHRSKETIITTVDLMRKKRPSAN